MVEPGFDASHLRALLAVLESEGWLVFRACERWMDPRQRHTRSATSGPYRLTVPTVCPLAGKPAQV